MPELFPSKARGAATGFTTLVLSAANLIVSLVFPLMLSAMGIAWVFMVFSVICLLSFFFAFYMVPETKGKSLEEIEASLKFQACFNFLQAFPFGFRYHVEREEK